MQIPNLTNLPADLEINPTELEYLENLQEPLFLKLNTENPFNQKYTSDQILIIIILINRLNNTVYSLWDLYPVILKINHIVIPKTSLN